MKDSLGSGDRRLRLWPAFVIVALQLLVRFGLPVAAPDVGAFAVVAGPAALAAVVVWWVLFSRAPWVERIGAVLLIAGAFAATPYVLHASVREGNMGVQFYLYGAGMLSLGFVAWAAITRDAPDRTRRATLAATVAIALGGFALFRSDGLDGEGAPMFTWRWAPTAEQRLLASSGDEPVAPAPVPAATRPAATWPGFRGPDRDGSIRGARIATDWSASPPVELWRRPVGPGVSSFAVHGGLAYTQEQRGDEELVTAYRVTSGQPVWRHGDAVRFQDAHVGAGPRATPAVGHGRVYTLGATGIVNALDAATGAVVWSRDGAGDAGRQAPDFGFTSSPLVAGELVVFALRGRLVAYDAATGSPRWYGPDQRGGSYGSPHLLSVGGIEQVVLLDGSGAVGVTPADGAVLWEHAWPGYSYVQPALTVDGDLLVGNIEAMPAGTLRLAVSRGPGGWSVEQRWSSRGLKPHFSGFVVHEGQAYGFDGRILACIDLATGERRWKGGRYGHGQVVLLRDQGLLLVLTERGELALVRATPDGFAELGFVPAIEGRTWNYPALAGNVVLVRNGEEMAAFRLPAGG